MAEDFNPVEEGRRIAREYLSKRGWAGEWRSALNRQLYPAASREAFEDKERQVDRMEEDAEAFFNREYEARKSNKDVLRAILEVLGPRTDLGFFAKRIIDRLKRDFRPL